MLVLGGVNIVTKMYVADCLVFVLNRPMSINDVEIELAFDLRALLKTVIVVRVVCVRAKDGESV